MTSQNGELGTLGRIAWEIAMPHSPAELTLLAEMIRVCRDNLAAQIVRVERECDGVRNDRNDWMKAYESLRVRLERMELSRDILSQSLEESQGKYIVHCDV